MFHITSSKNWIEICHGNNIEWGKEGGGQEGNEGAATFAQKKVWGISEGLRERSP